MTRLDEYDKEEWWDLVRSVKPDMDRERFDADWDWFCRLKAMGYFERPLC
jgi:hypothetical protein